jgi:gas vesicle protein
MDKEDAFWIGNCIGVVALLATIIILAPIKDKERRAYEAKQKAAAQAAQAIKDKQTQKAAGLKKPETTKSSTGSESAQSDKPAVDANSTGASQAAGAAAASRQKLHS